MRRKRKHVKTLSSSVTLIENGLPLPSSFDYLLLDELVLRRGETHEDNNNHQQKARFVIRPRATFFRRLF